MRIAARAHLYMASTAWARVTKRPSRQRSPAVVAAFVHAAFWRGHEEQYVGSVLRELEAALPAGDVALSGSVPRPATRRARGTIACPGAVGGKPRRA